MTGHIDPTKETFAEFRSNDRVGPIHMLNLVRLNAWAKYPDGRKVTGYEPFLDGFLPGTASTLAGRGAMGVTSGRPADALQLPDGSMLISDDTGNRLIRVSYGR